MPISSASPPAAKVAQMILPANQRLPLSSRSQSKPPYPAARWRQPSEATSHIRPGAVRHRPQRKPSFQYRSPRELHFGPNAGTFVLLAVVGTVGLLAGAIIGSTAGIVVAVVGLAAVVLGFLGFVNQW
ncbi:hypothetical protein [Hymenobacter glacieicola]|uniref:hypothetical protein n=1 Tax=Hymenobacter glacieicola TaxID=1562124 RepID=UPI0016681B8E|nr:hypothetical protein [Hymenobacter glacieicola]